MRYLGFLLVIAIVVYSVTDIVNAPEEDLQGLPRGVWIIIVVLFPILGSIAWFAIRHNARTRRPVTGGGAAAGPAPRRQGPLAPDDDPEFLWRLEQERRRRAGEGDPRPGTTPPPAEDDETR